VKPYFEQGGIRIFHGDCREMAASLTTENVRCIIADPPYGETSLEWDRWPEGWPGALAAAFPQIALSMWCWGSFRMFLERGAEIDKCWTLAQDIVWEKHNGSGFAADRFKRVHEFAVQWYAGAWGGVFKDPQVTNDATERQVRRKHRPPHTGEIGESAYTSEDGGPRLMRSVFHVRSEHGRAVNPTQKPIGVIEPLIRYSAAPGSVVLEPFMGSGTGLVVAKSLGLRAIGIDLREDQCEAAANRLIQELPLGMATS